MKKIIVFLLLGFSLTQCDSKAVSKPEKLISEDQMVDILYDLYIAKVIKSHDLNTEQLKDITPAEYIYHKYKIDSTQFAQSNKYYASDLLEYEKLHLRVTERLQVNKATIDTLILKNPDPVKPMKSPNKTTDTLKDKRELIKEMLEKKTKN